MNESDPRVAFEDVPNYVPRQRPVETSITRAFRLMRLVDLIKQTGGAVEIDGVRIEPCDAYGRTATIRALEAARETT